jgi:hypothetical protein
MRPPVAVRRRPVRVRSTYDDPVMLSMHLSTELFSAAAAHRQVLRHGS